MKKSILFLIAFMLLGLSFAKAQLVTMYDLTSVESKTNQFGITQNKSFILNAPSQNISINVSVTEVIESGGFSTRRFLKASVIFGTISFDRMSNGTQPEDGLWTKKVGNRTHLVRIDVGKKKYVYAFFDDQPNPMDEFNQKIQQKGF